MLLILTQISDAYSLHYDKILTCTFAVYSSRRHFLQIQGSRTCLTFSLMMKWIRTKRKRWVIQFYTLALQEYWCCNFNRRLTNINLFHLGCQQPHCAIQRGRRGGENLPEQRCSSAAQHDRDGQSRDDPGCCSHSVRDVHRPQGSGELSVAIQTKQPCRVCSLFHDNEVERRQLSPKIPSQTVPCWFEMELFLWTYARHWFIPLPLRRLWLLFTWWVWTGCAASWPLTMKRLLWQPATSSSASMTPLQAETKENMEKRRPWFWVRQTETCSFSTLCNPTYDVQIIL